MYSFQDYLHHCIATVARRQHEEKVARLKKEIEDKKKEERKKKSLKKKRKAGGSNDSDIESDQESREVMAVRTLKEANKLIPTVTNIIHHHSTSRWCEC